VSNRILVAVSIVIVIMLVRIDIRTTDLADRVDNIERVVHTNHRIEYTKRDIECLARNIYYEAGVESDIGKYAVAHVTVNRVKSGYWGNTVCKVVHAPKQFSWTLIKRLRHPDPALYERCKDIAVATLSGRGVKGLERSLFYHADYIKTPHWADPNQQVKKIGQHLFYNKAKNSNLEI